MVACMMGMLCQARRAEFVRNHMRIQPPLRGQQRTHQGHRQDPAGA